MVAGERAGVYILSSKQVSVHTVQWPNMQRSGTVTESQDSQSHQPSRNHIYGFAKGSRRAHHYIMDALNSCALNIRHGYLHKIDWKGLTMTYSAQSSN